LWWQDNSENTNNKKSDQYKNKYNMHKSLWNRDDFSNGWVELGWKNRQGEYFWGYWERPESAQIRSNWGYNNPFDY
jgi:hypothetical protein